MTQVKKGDAVKIHYTGKLEDETIFDTSFDSDPLEFTIGSGHVFSGLEQGIIGMKSGDKKTITLFPEEAFGKKNQDLIVNLEKSEFPQNTPFAVGFQLQIRGKDGFVADIKITEMTEDTVTVDANHPLAGETLIFDIELLEIS
ncbi:peptidylprolyl isomerase [Thermodesulfobacteriota bacterium]